MRKLIAEFAGPFSLVFAGTLTIAVDLSEWAVSLTFGLIVAAMICAIGRVSGAHINPAVTVGSWLARRFPGQDVGPYIACQITGACIASLLVSLIVPVGANLGTTTPSGPVYLSTGVGIALSTVLGFKLHGVAVAFAVGTVVGFVAFFGGPISGASMNPSRTVGPADVSGVFDGLWIYLIAPLVGSLAAVGLCRAACHPECCRAVETR